ncbi:MAG: hypothetical protein ACO263_06210 [Cyclobacteriaceae bacterium]|jgi:hypothetical protein
MKNLLSVLFVLMLSSTLQSQGFITALEENDMITLLGKPAIVTLADGTEVNGKFSAGVLNMGYLDRITIKGEDGEKMKIKPEEIVRVLIKASGLAKLSMLASSSSSIKEATKRDFNEIKNRDYIIFETAQRANKSGSLRLMQLLNPGFDSKIKVFANPNASQTTGIGVGGIKITGGEDKSYLMVKGGDKAVIVRKGSYKKNFEELYKTCPEMLKAFQGEKIQWDDVAGHVFAYDQMCKD